jgi:hypothetical protein
MMRALPTRQGQVRYQKGVARVYGVAHSELGSAYDGDTLRLLSGTDHIRVPDLPELRRASRLPTGCTYFINGIAQTER